MMLPGTDEDRVVSVRFDDGSLATITSTVRGDKTLGVQEQIRVRRGDLTIEINDYCAMRASRKGRTLVRARSRRDKGHTAMYRNTLERIRLGQPSSYTSGDLRSTTELLSRAFTAESARDRQAQDAARKMGASSAMQEEGGQKVVLAQHSRIDAE